MDEPENEINLSLRDVVRHMDKALDFRKERLDHLHQQRSDLSLAIEEIQKEANALQAALDAFMNEAGGTPGRMREDSQQKPATDMPEPAVSVKNGRVMIEHVGSTP